MLTNLQEEKKAQRLNLVEQMFYTPKEWEQFKKECHPDDVIIINEDTGLTSYQIIDEYGKIVDYWLN